MGAAFTAFTTALLHGVAFHGDLLRLTNGARKPPAAASPTLLPPAKPSRHLPTPRTPRSWKISIFWRRTRWRHATRSPWKATPPRSSLRPPPCSRCSSKGTSPPHRPTPPLPPRPFTPIWKTPHPTSQTHSPPPARSWTRQTRPLPLRLPLPSSPPWLPPALLPMQQSSSSLPPSSPSPTTRNSFSTIIPLQPTLTFLSDPCKRCPTS